MITRPTLLRSALWLLLTPQSMVTFADDSALIDQYTAITLASYEDSLITAEALQSVANSLVKRPSAANLESARDARLAARVPYQQTEAFRLGNPIVDD